MSTSREPEPEGGAPTPSAAGHEAEAAASEPGTPAPEATAPETRASGSDASVPEPGVSAPEASAPGAGTSAPEVSEPGAAVPEPDPKASPDGADGDTAEASRAAAGTQVPGTGGDDPGYVEPRPFGGADDDAGGPQADRSGRKAGNRREPGGWLSRVKGVARPQETGESEPVKPVSDEDLVRALYAEHAAPLLRYALRMTDGDRQRAEDIVQETLLRAWMHPEAIADRPARPWLFAVARNLAVDAHRARKARPHEVGESALSLVAVPDEADRVLESWAVADALAALRPDHRRVLLETYYRGRSVAEAATVLGIPAGTVKSRAFYALRALRLALEERGLAP